MATRMDNEVTLPHSEACDIAKILSDYASAQFDHARKTHSNAIQYQCQRDGVKAREHATWITARLYSWI